ncbi:hypothetical protein N0V82_003066 [Gnomoniopsis sp. IMI 355080]|nr:hypothetical protein N0V82_003066 [Gnomoniopsis sp. IMI 355080]
MHTGCDPPTIQLEKEEREYLEKVCVPAFKSLLEHARSYSSAEAEDHLRAFTDCMALWIRGRQFSSLPTAKLPIGKWAPMTLSINYKASLEDNNVARTVRFTVEPHKTESMAVLYSLARLLGDPDMSWSDQVADALLCIHPSLTVFAGIDCDGPSRKLKTYLNLPKMSDTGISRNSFVLDTIRNLKNEAHHIDLAPALDLLEDYLVTPDGSRLFLHPIGMDCPDSSSNKAARIKIYALLPLCNSWSMVKSVHTFGGKLTLDQGRKANLEKLRSIWNLLRGEPQELRTEDEDFDKPPRYPKHFVNGLIFSFELISGQDVPEVKTYVPPYQYSPTDRHIASNIAQDGTKPLMTIL